LFRKPNQIVGEKHRDPLFAKKAAACGNGKESAQTCKVAAQAAALSSLARVFAPTASNCSFLCLPTNCNHSELTSTASYRWRKLEEVASVLPQQQIVERRGLCVERRLADDLILEHARFKNHRFDAGGPQS
jgi:hypothetical protein